jgi:ABC-2 type transport system ATP-binding protein
MIESPAFYPYLSGLDNLRLLAEYAEVPRQRIDEVLELVDLAERAKDRFSTYSLGMKQRLGVAAALLKDPELVILDEPTNGLDPAGMRDMRDLIRELSARGMTVLLSSHLLGEVEELCNRVAIVRKGGLAYQGSLAELKHQAGGGYLLRTSDDDVARRVAAAQAGISELRAGVEGGLTFDAESDAAVGALSLALAESGALITELSPRQASLEDLFFKLTEDEADPVSGQSEPELAERAA